MRTVSLNPAKVHVSADLYPDAPGERSFSFEISKDGKTVISTGPLTSSEAELTVPDAMLWDEDHPDLYTLKAEVFVNGKSNTEPWDSAKTSFGIRMVSCSEQGLFVNGKETLLRGGCLHSDNGIIGTASFPEAELRKARLLKEAGFNAIRSAHNPCSPALLSACDRLGIYVMDEGWDMWYKRKTRYDYGDDFMDNYEADIRAMVDTDYNHPSVLMYSIGNEISEPAEERGVELAGKLADTFRSLDPDRLVTVGCNITILSSSKAGHETFDPDSDSSNGVHDDEPRELDSTAFNELMSQMGSNMEMSANSDEADQASAPVFEKVDIAGYNYAYGRYEMDGKLHPGRLINGSETFPHCIYRNWSYVKKLPYLIGDFMWTAIDYIGEVGIGAWSYTPDGNGFTKPYPWLLGETGAMDLLGTPTGELYMAQAAWDKLDCPAIAVSPNVAHPGIIPAHGAWRGTNTIPSWSFRGCEGNPTEIEVYGSSGAASAELFVNGKSAGRKKLEDGRALFSQLYEAGTIEAVLFDAAGQETSRSSLSSASGDLSLRLQEEKPEKPDELQGSFSLRYVKIELTGENGVVESNSDAEVEVSVRDGILLGFGSARARSEESFLSGTYRTYYGRALAAVLLRKGDQAVLHAKCQHLESELTLV